MTVYNNLVPSPIPAMSSVVTITIASPAVVTWTAHGLSNGQPVIFSTTGALPTGLTAGTVYYVTAATTNTFQVSATNGGGAISTSGTQSGVHTATYGFSVSLSGALSVQSKLPGTDGSTLDAWTLSQTASGQGRLTLTMQGAGTGLTQYASVYVRKVAPVTPPAVQIQAFPALVFSKDDNTGSSTPVGFSVVLDEVKGLVMSSYALVNTQTIQTNPISGDSPNYGYGVHSLTVGSVSFWLIWVSLLDDGTSTEFTVDLYPASYGNLASVSNPIYIIATKTWFTPIPLIGSPPLSSTADFTKITVSTSHP